MRALGFALAIWIAAFAGTAMAADAKGNFALRGAGRISCQELLGGLEAKDQRLAVFGHWLEGYITANNQLLGATYDVTPWQTTELLLALAGRACAARKDANFMDVIGRLVAEMRPLRLTEQSSLVQLRFKDAVQVHYHEVVERVRARLVDLGYQFREPTIIGPAALAELQNNLLDFQTKRRLPPTGALDQQTLLNLFVLPKPKE